MNIFIYIFILFIQLIIEKCFANIYKNIHETNSVLIIQDIVRQTDTYLVIPTFQHNNFCQTKSV